MVERPWCYGQHGSVICDADNCGCVGDCKENDIGKLLANSSLDPNYEEVKRK